MYGKVREDDKCMVHWIILYKQYDWMTRYQREGGGANKRVNGSMQTFILFGLFPASCKMSNSEDWIPEVHHWKFQQKRQRDQVLPGQWTYKLDLALAPSLLIIIIALLDSEKDLDFHCFPGELQLSELLAASPNIEKIPISLYSW